VDDVQGAIKGIVMGLRASVSLPAAIAGALYARKRNPQVSEQFQQIAQQIL